MSLKQPPNLQVTLLVTLASSLTLIIGFIFIWPGSLMDWFISFVIAVFSIPAIFIFSALGVYILQNLKQNFVPRIISSAGVGMTLGILGYVLASLFLYLEGLAILVFTITGLVAGLSANKSLNTDPSDAGAG